MRVYLTDKGQAEAQAWKAFKETDEFASISRSDSADLGLVIFRAFLEGWRAALKYKDTPTEEKDIEWPSSL